MPTCRYLSVLLLAGGIALMPGCVKRAGSDPLSDGMFGKVVDRNDQPLRNVKIRVSPGNVDLITNRWGEFQVTHVYDTAGNHEELKNGEDYKIDIYRPGFHSSVQVVTYEGGPQNLPLVTLVEESIPLTDDKGGGDKAYLEALKGSDNRAGRADPGVSVMGE